MFQQRRVLERVLDRRRARRGGVAMVLRPIVVIGVLLVAGVTAAATFGHTWIAQGLRSLGSRAPAVAMAPEATARPHRRAAPIAEILPLDQADPSGLSDLPDRPDRPNSGQVQPLAPPATRAAPKLAVRSHAAVRPEGRGPEARTEDPSLVVDAIRALRTDHDSRRAAALLASYLRTYPHGALSEEALALSIEAAAASRNPSAATFAAHYLREYPHGRFHRAAEQALEQRQP